MPEHSLTGSLPRSLLSIRRRRTRDRECPGPQGSIENDGSDGFARMHEVEALVDVFERHGV
ncbi:hypothetical protein, partial [Roseibium sp. MMSF_3412]|uniref:hypothetical protein n=1 Tax=Roseibium sp. MMSF_3412 TaxID=3046712 RepID=UPI00273DE306